MDTLADLASMQSHQPTKPGLFKNSSMDSIKSSDSTSRFSVQQAALTSNPRASFDINMMDAPKSTARTDFSKAAISDDQQARLHELATHLIECPSAYESHIAMINTLHRLFIDYVYPISSTGDALPRQDPTTFDLLDELRSSRNTMEKLFAVGEAIWLDWLQDESMLARSTEERIDVIEKFRKAVDEEACSTKIWSAYGEWVLECFRWANQDTGSADLDEDRMVGKEIFTWQMVMETWQDAVDNTKNDLALSHLVWNKYIDLRTTHSEQSLPKDQANAVLKLFEQRLKIPHIASDTTRQVLSTFMNSHFSQEQYFEIMEDTSRIMKPALKLLDERSSFEAQIEATQLKEDRGAEYSTFLQYIEWEKTTGKRRKLNFELCNALYQRAELRFPSDTALWDDHVAFVLENSKPVLALLSRATKHCPWSGALWSHYLLASDRLAQSYEDTEAIKHKATRSGILEAAGVEEVLKVHIAWCSYLRRRAFRADRDEDDGDIAEIGIRASLESISSLGAKLGVGDNPDPFFRLQRIYINFLSESGRWDNARREFDNAIKDYGKSWRFWLRFHHWEMMRWRRFVSKDTGYEPLASTSLPQLATAVLKQALEQDGLDYPEPIIEELISHCEDHEDADELQVCLLKVRKLEKVLAARRQIEAVQSAEAAAAQQKQATVAANEALDTSNSAKRKREAAEPEEDLHDNFKKSKMDEEAVQTVEQTSSENPRRDREHATILVENLPEAVSEAKVRQYFSACGTVKAIKLLDNSTSAVIELEDDQAAQYALSRNGQQFDGAVISVVLDTGSTVFLTNYSPTTDEQTIREMLSSYGDIISIRFPSLQGNKRRRFCYVQFKLPAEAQNAVNHLDDADIDGLRLSCKISNPAVKKSRQEMSVNDGRTVFVGRLNFKAKEEEVKTAFAGYGSIELVRMPLHESMKNRNKGIAFVTFTSTDEAQAALDMNGKKIKDREIKVEIATDEQSRSTRQGSVANKTAKSSTPAIHNGGTGVHSASPVPGLPSSSEPRSERTIFLTQIPDTVNEARLRHAAAKHGDVVKCILKTNHQGALIEYTTIAQAGEAALGLDGYEIDPGRQIRVVSEEEMKTQKPEKKVDTIASKPKPKLSAPTPAGGFVKRPTQPGSRARKGGNLGQRSVLLHTSGVSHEPDKDMEVEDSAVSSDVHSTQKKSNSDFRALMTGKHE